MRAAPKPEVQSALSFYSQQKQNSKSMQKIKKKKQSSSSSALAGLKKMLGTKSSSVTDALKLMSDQSSTTVKKAKNKSLSTSNGETVLIVPSATPQLAKPDLLKVNGSFKTKAKSPKLKKMNIQSLHVSANSEKAAKLASAGTSANHSSESISKKSKQNGIDKKIASFAFSTKGSSSNVAVQKRKQAGKKLPPPIPMSSDSQTESPVITVKPMVESSNEKKKKAMKVRKSAEVKEDNYERDDKQTSQQKRKLHSDDTTVSKKKSLSSSKIPPVLKMLDSLESTDDMKKRGQRVLAYLLAPYDITEFFTSYWETKHLLIKRKNRNYLDGLFSTRIFDCIVREQYVEYTKNLDVTSYSDGQRQTHNTEGRVYPLVMWDYYSNSCSLRLLNPQTFHLPVWHLLAAMQDYMGSFCGSNMYLTPAGTQGFAPHWDDIEAFILQLEGKKRWRVYKPRNPQEVLPRFSSANLSQKEIGEPILDVILEAGDVLYFPRGFIHQAEAVADTHSMHITISTYQKNAWVDLFEKMFSPSALSQVAASNVALRKGLPLGCLDYMGMIAAANSDDKRSCTASTKNSGKNMAVLQQRKQFKEKVVSLMMKHVLTDATIDKAVDDFARQFVRVALPPCLAEDEVSCTVKADGERWGKGGVKGRVEMEPDTKIKLLGPYTIRVVREPTDPAGDYRVYYSVENSLEYEGRDEQHVVVDEDNLAAVRHLVQAYPAFTAVEDLPLKTLEDKLTVSMALWEQQLLITEDPLNSVDDELTSDEEHCCSSDDCSSDDCSSDHCCHH